MKTITLKTWNEWESEGFHVIRGQKATAYNSRNQALFSKTQVTKTIHHNYGYDYEERKTFMKTEEREPERVYYEDGSGYVNYGGPCGPLYFDRNGNT